MSNDRDLELGAALRALPTPEHDSGFWDELEDRLAGEPAVTRLSDHQRKRRPFPGTWLLSAAAAVALVVGTVAVLARDDEGKDTDVTVTETTQPRPEGSRWTDVPGGPLSGRSNPITVWTGSEVIVWSGMDGNGVSFDDGAIYHPGQQRWTSMSPPPSPLVYPKGVWAGDRMVVIGMAGSTVGEVAEERAIGLSYDPATDRWTRLAESPLPTLGDQSLVWTGDRLIVWGGSLGEEARADGASYDPQTDTWEELPDAPLKGRFDHFAAWIGDRMLVWGGGAGEEVSRVEYLDGATYDPHARTWAKLPDAPATASPALGVAWTGTELVVVGERSTFIWNAIGGEWLSRPGFPLTARFDVMVNSAGSNRVLVWGGSGSDGATYGDGALFDSSSGWTELPSEKGAERAGAGSAWTGSILFFWGGSRGTTFGERNLLADGIEFHPGTNTSVSTGSVDAPPVTVTTLPGQLPMTTVPVQDCGSVGFAANSDDVAGAIAAQNMTCEEARSLVRVVGSEVGVVSGPDRLESGDFVCVRTAQEETGLPVSVFECTGSGARKVTFSRS